MGLDFKLVDGQTPLDEEEKDGLLISTITTHGELDEYEQRNIEKAIQWTLTRPVFTWGANSNLIKPEDTRGEYLMAVKPADKNDINPLLEFARK